MVHEIPHEIGDFAILLKSGFTRWDAAVFQLLTASGGLMGSFIAIIFSGAGIYLEFFDFCNFCMLFFRGENILDFAFYSWGLSTYRSGDGVTGFAQRRGP